MKIIDLLNKIANGEEVPKKIKYNDYIYTAKGNAIENFVDYCSEEDEWCFNHYVRYENLNDIVEIIEEEKKVPEKRSFKLIEDEKGTIFIGNKKYKMEEILEEKKIPKKLFHCYTDKLTKDFVIKCNNDLVDKINEILDYLKSKGE